MGVAGKEGLDRMNRMGGGIHRMRKEEFTAENAEGAEKSSGEEKGEEIWTGWAGLTGEEGGNLARRA